MFVGITFGLVINELLDRKMFSSVNPVFFYVTI